MLAVCSVMLSQLWETCLIITLCKTCHPQTDTSHLMEILITTANHFCSSQKGKRNRILSEGKERKSSNDGWHFCRCEHVSQKVLEGKNCPNCCFMSKSRYILYIAVCFPRENLENIECTLYEVTAQCVCSDGGARGKLSGSPTSGERRLIAVKTLYFQRLFCDVHCPLLWKLFCFVFYSEFFKVCCGST